MSLTDLVHWVLLEQLWQQKAYWRLFWTSHHIYNTHHQDWAIAIHRPHTITANTIDRSFFLLIFFFFFFKFTSKMPCSFSHCFANEIRLNLNWHPKKTINIDINTNNRLNGAKIHQRNDENEHLSTYCIIYINIASKY